MPSVQLPLTTSASSSSPLSSFPILFLIHQRLRQHLSVTTINSFVSRTRQHCREVGSQNPGPEAGSSLEATVGKITHLEPTTPLELSTSDLARNRPFFGEYKAYSNSLGEVVTIYLLVAGGSPEKWLETNVHGTCGFDWLFLFPRSSSRLEINMYQLVSSQAATLVCNLPMFGAVYKKSHFLRQIVKKMIV